MVLSSIMNQPHGPKSVSALYKREIAPLKDQRIPKLRTFLDWYARGSKFAVIAAGGKPTPSLFCFKQTLAHEK